MFSFRQKIFLSYLGVLLIFLALLFPFALHTVKRIVFKAMEDRSDELIEKIQSAPNNDALVRILKDQRPVIFFRVSIITNEKKVLYDSHTKHLLGPRFSQEYIVDHPEVMEAFKDGVGYSEDYSELLGQQFAYMAKTFDFHGKTYVLRTAFPYKYVDELTQDFQNGFLSLAALVLLLFTMMTWLIIYNLTRPIQKIINAVKPYQQGLQKDLPVVSMDSINSNDDFGRLASTLNSLSTKIQKQIDVLKDFSANASHELKTPITIIRGFAEALHENPNLPKDVVEDVTGKIVNNCKRMTAIIKDLLTLADIEQLPSSRLVECDLHSIILNCCHMVQEVHRDANIVVNLESNREMRLLADPTLMEMAFLNLIENGAKYSSSPAQITITMHNDGSHITVAIADQGIGIPDEDQEHVFQRFYTVDKTRSRKLGGTGLGLSIVEGVIEKHHGAISLSSKLGAGSTFTVTLPNKQPAFS